MSEKKIKNYTKRNVTDFNQDKADFQEFGRWLISRTLIPLFFRVEYTGIENIPKNKKIIVAANHISYFDPFLLGEAIKIPIAFMGKKELFENKILAYLIDRLGCFAVNREKLEVSTIKTAINVFKTSDWILGIFPQGGIRKNKKLEKINKGFAVIAKQMKADILPVGITGCEEYNWNPFRKREIKVSVGEIVSYNQDYNSIIDEWGQKVSNLISYEYVKHEFMDVSVIEKEPQTIS